MLETKMREQEGETREDNHVPAPPRSLLVFPSQLPALFPIMSEENLGKALTARKVSMSSH